MSSFDAYGIAAEAESRGEDALSTVVFQALGAASVCWETTENAGVFDDHQAKSIGDSLVDYLNHRTRTDPTPVVDKPTVEQEIRTLAIQVAANRCENVDELIKFASEIEAYLLNGTVPAQD